MSAWLEEAERRWIEWQARELAPYALNQNDASLGDPPEFGPVAGFDGADVVYSSQTGLTVMTSDGRTWADRDADGTYDMELFYNNHTSQWFGDADQNGTFETLFGG